jgi:hypothetical protein
MRYLNFYAYILPKFYEKRTEEIQERTKLNSLKS